MFRALSTGALGMSAQQKSVDNIANNLANVNTTGYKRTSIAFQDMFYEKVASSKHGAAASRPANDGPSLEIGHGSQPVATLRNFMQGPVEETGAALDVAINGTGFFQVEMPDGSIAYTRDGNFSRDSSGLMVNNSGLPLADMIEIPMEAVGIEISQEGVVTAQMAGDAGQIDLGQIEMAKFINPGGLTAMGDNLFSETEASGMPFYGNPGEEGFGVLRQGYLEQSNVDIVNEMVKLIEAQRAYETNSKVVQTAEDMMQVTNGIKR
ncbi:flagellar basal-body rod protein FlgG [Natronogracilivirga saccharolytica]|uniref:Flagellar basal-body rod protein FlgG n=1 Tax=Natronogracilivirga saccharolytica TaxID=2812953 RepID=A0A8J7UU25_9BACT|nr:flagellar basal-body rod protein FlgG [Natronogracilivirga saccharolytica]MBP3191960.1 flagellar basal-body rod protein FlgG [Natronogracilivirga saccharolytica]